MTLDELFENSEPQWSNSAMVKAFESRGFSIAMSTIRRHRKGEEPTKNFKKIYCEIFQLSENQIQWKK